MSPSPNLSGHEPPPSTPIRLQLRRRQYIFLRPPSPSFPQRVCMSFCHLLLLLRAKKKSNPSALPAAAEAAAKFRRRRRRRVCRRRRRRRRGNNYSIYLGKQRTPSKNFELLLFVVWLVIFSSSLKKRKYIEGAYSSPPYPR